MDPLHSMLFDEEGGAASPLGSGPREAFPPKARVMQTPPRPSPGRGRGGSGVDFITQAREWRKHNPGLLPGSPMSPGGATPSRPASWTLPAASDDDLAQPMSVSGPLPLAQQFQFASTAPASPRMPRGDPEYFQEVRICSALSLFMCALGVTDLDV